jgi:hypothetical protein
MANVVPHSTSLFNAITLCLRRDGVVSRRPEYGWEVEAETACEFIENIGGALRGGAIAGCFPSALELRIVGAEPFAGIEDLEKILRCGAANNLVGHIWTTGAWVTSAELVRAVLDRLSDTMHTITLCIDADELDELGLGRCETLLNALREKRLGAVIECCVRPDSPLPLKLLGSESINNNSSFIRIVPAPGKADARENPADYFLGTPQPYDRCAERLSFTVLPDGDVYPCLRGIGVDAMKLGSLSRQRAEEILHRARNSRPLARLRSEGPAHLFELARAAGEWTTETNFVDACELHVKLLAGASNAWHDLLSRPQTLGT